MANRTLEQLFNDRILLQQAIFNYRLQAVLAKLATTAAVDIGIKLEREKLEFELAKPDRNYPKIQNLLDELEILLRMDSEE